MLPSINHSSHAIQSTSAPEAEVIGVQDGPEIVLTSGVKIRRTFYGSARVSQTELNQAINGIKRLPLADQKLLARLNIPIELIPTAALESARLGVTTIIKTGDRWMPTRVRIASKSPVGGIGNGRTELGKVIQHEIGHVIAVYRNNDTSEDAAENYAARH